LKFFRCRFRCCNLFSIKIFIIASPIILIWLCKYDLMRVTCPYLLCYSVKPQFYCPKMWQILVANQLGDNLFKFLKLVLLMLSTVCLLTKPMACTIKHYGFVMYEPPNWWVCMYNLVCLSKPEDTSLLQNLPISCKLQILHIYSTGSCILSCKTFPELIDHHSLVS